MHVYFTGCRNITVQSAIPWSEGYGSLKRFNIAGASAGSNGTFSGEAAGLSLHVDGQGNMPWSLTVENQDRFHNNVWVESLVMVTNSPQGTTIAANDDNQGSQGAVYDDLILLCEPCQPPLTRPLPHEAAWTWVSWGVTVDAGGPTGRGPVPPWGPLLKELAAGLALADLAELVHTDLRTHVRELAAKQISATAAEIAAKVGGRGAP